MTNGTAQWMEKWCNYHADEFAVESAPKHVVPERLVLRACRRQRLALLYHKTAVACLRLRELELPLSERRAGYTPTHIDNIV